MFKLKTRIKKIIAITAAVFAMGMIVITPARGEAQSGGSSLYLQYITEYTYLTARATYYINKFTFNMMAMLNSWVLPDQSDTTINLQTSFVNATNTVLQDQTTQANLQRQLMQEYLGKDYNPDTMDYTNDFTYQTMLGQPYLEPDPRIQNGEKNINPPYGFIKNASGMNLVHPLPQKNWKGFDPDKKKYINYYTTVSSIQSYDAYVLSQMYVETTNKTPLKQQQNALMQQASSPDWFVQVASESMGIVMRQILMYNSQTYVLLTQLLQTQKQLLSAEVMTNTLLVMGNQFTETQLLNRANPG